MYNRILQLIEEISTSCIDELERGDVNLALYDVKKINSKILIASSFQLSLVYESLLAARPHIKNISKLDRALESIKVKMEKNFKNNKFNYFDSSHLPDDLDTASVMTRILDRMEVSIAYTEVLKNNRLPNGFISTWFDSQFKKSNSWASGDNVFHVDVMMNYFLTLLKCDMHEHFELNLVRNLINQQGLINYWYIPSFYSSYLYSKVLMLGTHFFDDADISILKDHISFYIPNVNLEQNLTTSCKHKKIKKVIQNEHSNNWLNRIFYLGSLCNCAILNNKRSYALEKIIIQEIERIEVERFNIVPALYWSLGFKSFKSKLLNNAIYLEVLCTVVNYYFTFLESE